MIGSLEHRGSGSNVDFIPDFRNYIVSRSSSLRLLAQKVSNGFSGI